MPSTAPFDHAKADIILRSSDNIDFRVFKLFLSLTSPVFETLFDIPQPAAESEDQEIKDGLAVIPVTENSKTLDALLRFCYPCTLADDPALEVLQDALDVLNAAKKYSLDAIEKKARQAIANPKILAAAPLRCFAIARRGGLREETLLAAKYTLTQPLIPVWFQEIELISASDLLALLTYHRKCGEAMYSLKSDSSWITSSYGSAGACNWLSSRSQEFGLFLSSNPPAPSSSACGCLEAATSAYTLFARRALYWWADFMEETFTELREKPCKETVRACADKTTRAVKAKNCSTCSPGISEGMRGFVDVFGSKIEEIISQIELGLNF